MDEREFLRVRECVGEREREGECAGERGRVCG